MASGIKTAAGLSLAMLLMVGSASSQAEDFNTGSVLLSIENDMIAGTDREYSSGVYLKFNSKGVADANDFTLAPVRFVANLLPLGTYTNKVWGLSLGQQIWTPTDIELVEQTGPDRAYAGVVSISTYIHEYSPKVSNKYRLEVGHVGPDSYAEETQKVVHAMINSPTPMGWDEQRQERIIYSLAYERQKLLARTNVSHTSQVDMGLHGRGKLGNYKNEITMAVTFRYGNNLHESFGAVETTDGGIIDSGALSRSIEGHYLYLSTGIDYVISDYLVEGASSDPDNQITIQHLRPIVSAGFAYYRSTWGAAVGVKAKTRSFEQDSHNIHAYGSLDLFYRF